jgi:hypothetical protein
VGQRTYVLSVQPWRIDSADEELRAICYIKVVEDENFTYGRGSGGTIANQYVLFGPALAIERMPFPW